MWPSTIDGRPAFGRHERKVRACCARYRRCSVISRGPGRAVQADDVGAHRVERGERRADLGADEHAAGRLDRHLDHQRHRPAGRRHRPAAPRSSAALPWRRSWTVSTRITSTPPSRSPVHLRHVVVAQVGERDVAERRELGARADRPDHEAGAVGGRVRRRRPPGRCGPRRRSSRGSARGCRTRRARPGTPRTWRSRRRRSRPRSTRRASRAIRSGRVSDEVLVAALEGRPAEVVGGQGWPWTQVPNAPSKTRTRSRSAARKSTMNRQGYRSPTWVPSKIGRASP